MIAWILFVLVWLAFGFVSAGWEFAFFQREFPDISAEYFDEDQRLASAAFSLGLISFLTSIELKSYRHGWAAWWRKQP